MPLTAPLDRPTGVGRRPPHGGPRPGGVGVVRAPRRPARGVADRRCAPYAGSAPVTRQSGESRHLAHRRIKNNRLAARPFARSLPSAANTTSRLHPDRLRVPWHGRHRHLPPVIQQLQPGPITGPGCGSRTRPGLRRAVDPARYGELVHFGKVLDWHDGTPPVEQDQVHTLNARTPVSAPDATRRWRRDGPRPCQHERRPPLRARRDGGPTRRQGHHDWSRQRGRVGCTRGSQAELSLIEWLGSAAQDASRRRLSWVGVPDSAVQTMICRSGSAAQVTAFQSRYRSPTTG
ncbi:hypothetical protein SAMN05216489_00469 [Streptomyces sp. 3213]|nr:hypothetical protein SAMN05216489_00469 [Streptomyces sp. 3213] [Streptomyces sp. 3213.3]